MTAAPPLKELPTAPLNLKKCTETHDCKTMTGSVFVLGVLVVSLRNFETHAQVGAAPVVVAQPACVVHTSDILPTREPSVTSCTSQSRSSSTFLGISSRVRPPSTALTMFSSSSHCSPGSSASARVAPAYQTLAEIQNTTPHRLTFVSNHSRCFIARPHHQTSVRST